MKRKNKMMAIILAAFAMLIVTACNGQKFSAKEYTEGLMEIMTTGKTAKNMGPHAEELAELYETAMGQMTGPLMESEKIDEELANEFKDVIAKYLAKAKYTVGEEKKTEEGCKVDVTIEPIQLMSADFQEKYKNEMQNYLQDMLKKGTAVDEAEITKTLFKKTIELLNEGIDNISYGEAQTITVEYIKNGDGWEIKDQEKTKDQILASLFDLSGLNN